MKYRSILDVRKAAIGIAAFCSLGIQSTSAGNYFNIDEASWPCVGVDLTNSSGTVGQAVFQIRSRFSEDYWEADHADEEGSAFLIDKENGYILTAFHVLYPAEEARRASCQDLTATAESVELSTDVLISGLGADPTYERVNLSLVDGGQDACKDFALLKIDPKYVRRAREFELSVNWVDDVRGGFQILDIKGAGVPTSDVARYSVNVVPLQRSSNSCQQELPQVCCANACLMASGNNAVLGHRGGPLTNAKGLVYGLIARRSENTSDSSIVISSNGFLDQISSVISIEDERVSQIREMAISGSPELFNLGMVGNLELMQFSNAVLADNGSLELEPNQIICPLASAASARRLSQQLVSKLHAKALVDAQTDSNPEVSRRAIAREVAQNQFAYAQKSLSAGDIASATKASAISVAAMEQSIGLYLEATDYAPLVASFNTSLSTGTPDHLGTRLTMVAPQFVNTYSVDTMSSETGTSRVLSSLLREYADAANLYTLVTDAPPQELLLEPAAAAYWSGTLSRNEVERARSFRTLGDSLAYIGLYHEASDAYSAAISVSSTNAKGLSSSILPRFIETSELAGNPVENANLKSVLASRPDPASFSDWSNSTRNFKALVAAN